MISSPTSTPLRKKVSVWETSIAKTGAASSAGTTSLRSVPSMLTVASAGYRSPATETEAVPETYCPSARFMRSGAASTPVSATRVGSMRVS